MLAFTGPDGDLAMLTLCIALVSGGAVINFGFGGILTIFAPHVGQAGSSVAMSEGMTNELPQEGQVTGVGIKTSANYALA